MNKNKWYLMFKIESAYNTDAAPVAGTDNFYTSRPSIKPVYRSQDRRRMRTGYGGTPKLLTGETVQIEFEYELPADWDASLDTAPEVGTFLRACNFTETTNTGASIVYANNSSVAGESATSWIYLDNHLYKVTGLRGSVSGAHVAGEMIVLKFTFEGIFKSALFVADGTFPTFTPSINANPLLFENASLAWTGFAAPIVKNFNWDLGNEIAKRMDGNSDNGIHSVFIKNTMPKFDADPDIVALSTNNPFTALEAGTLIDLSCEFLNTTRKCALAINDCQLLDADGNGDDEDINKYALKFESAAEADVSFTFTNVA